MRYNRINLDGKSMTETLVTAAALLPGTLAVISSGEFAQASAVKGRMYVMHPARDQGLTVADAVPSGDSGVGEYVEEGRELAILCPAGTYAKDTPIKLGTAGKGAIASSDTDDVIGYSQDAVVIGSGLTDLIRVRMRVGTVAAA